MILADTSVWVDHLNGRPSRLGSALNEQLVMVHPFVIGEIACGNFPARTRTLAWMENLPHTIAATHTDVMELIARRHLMGTGVGFIDAHLLASVMITPATRLWTNDKRLAAVAAALGVAYNTLG